MVDRFKKPGLFPPSPADPHADIQNEILALRAQIAEILEGYEAEVEAVKNECSHLQSSNDAFKNEVLSRLRENALALSHEVTAFKRTIDEAFAALIHDHNALTLEHLKEIIGYIPASEAAVKDVRAELDRVAGVASNKIVNTASGDVVTLRDSANHPIESFIVYGRTTQDGSPTPDAPIPLVTVGADGNVKVSSKAGIPEGGKEHITTITTASGLPGLPVDSGGNYTDANGQRGIADTIEYDAGTAKRVQRVWYGRITSTSHLWSPSSNLTGRYSINNPTPAALKGVAPMCTAFPGQVNTTSASNRMYINGAGTQLVFNTPFATVDEWKAYLDANEVYLAYALATPIETELSAEETAQLVELTTYYPETTIYNEDGAHMVVEYVADTKKYIDAKFDALAAAIIS